MCTEFHPYSHFAFVQDICPGNLLATTPREADLDERLAAGVMLVSQQSARVWFLHTALQGSPAELSTSAFWNFEKISSRSFPESSLLLQHHQKGSSTEKR